MTHVFADRVVDTTSTTGTGAISLDDAGLNGYQLFGDVCANGDTIYYSISHRRLDQWEVGRGTYGSGANALTRTTVLASSNSGGAVNFSSGLKDVVASIPAIYLEQMSPDPANLTTLSVADDSNDWLQVYDTSSTTWKKIHPKDVSFQPTIAFASKRTIVDPTAYKTDMAKFNWSFGSAQWSNHATPGENPYFNHVAGFGFNVSAAAVRDNLTLPAEGLFFESRFTNSEAVFAQEGYFKCIDTSGTERRPFGWYSHYDGSRTDANVSADVIYFQTADNLFNSAIFTPEATSGAVFDFFVPTGFSSGIKGLRLVFSEDAAETNKTIVAWEMRANTNWDVLTKLQNDHATGSCYNNILAAAGSAYSSYSNATLDRHWSVGKNDSDNFAVAQAATLGSSVALSIDRATLAATFGASITSTTGLISGSTVQLAAASALFWNGRSALQASADGSVLMTNAAGTAFSLLQFGGITNSYPALKRSSASLICRVASDDANALFESLSLKTDAPNGGTSGTWKLGVAASVSPTSPNRTIEVDIGGTIYYIHAKTTNN